MPVRLYIGVGNFPIDQQHIDIMNEIGDGWVYIDKYVYNPKVVNADAECLPYPPQSLDTIYASHLLEHLPYINTIKILSHWYSLLKEGGKLILNVPDLLWVCEEFIKLYALEGRGRGDEYTNHHYRWTINHDKYGASFMVMLFGNQENEGEFHRAGFTDRSLREALQKAKFKKITITKEFENHNMQCLIAVAKK